MSAKQPESVVFLYCLVDHSQGEQGVFKDAVWMSEAERDQRQRELSDPYLIWERDPEATPRRDLSYLVQAICSLYWLINISQFREIVRSVRSEESPAVERLYQQYANLFNALVNVDVCILLAIAMVYHQSPQGEEELIGNEAVHQLPVQSGSTSPVSTLHNLQTSSDR